MPHPKNRLKLTGDTRMPDVGFEPIGETDAEMLLLVPEEEAQARVYADGWVPPPQQAATGPEPQPSARSAAEAAVRTVEQLPARSPWLAIAIGIALGWAVARTVRGLQR